MLTNKVSATAYCADAVNASAETDVKAIPAVLLEVVDVTDPVEVGTRTTYVITVTNQGSAPSTNIEIVCNLEENVRYVSSSGLLSTNSPSRLVTRQAPLWSAKAISF